VRYGCMSRPWVPTQAKPKRTGPRDWFDEPDDNGVDWKTA
jgi:hypothetical protein